jgi:hypothetical protein
MNAASVNQESRQLSGGVVVSQRHQFAAQMVHEWFVYTEVQYTIPSNSGVIQTEKDACHIRATKRIQWYPEFGRSTRMTFMNRLWPLLPDKWRTALYLEHRDSDRDIGHRRKCKEMGESERAFKEHLANAYAHIQYVWDNRLNIMV